MFRFEHFLFESPNCLNVCIDLSMSNAELPFFKYLQSCYLISTFVLFSAGSYVALTLLGKPSHSSRDSIKGESSVSGPQPVDVSTSSPPPREYCSYYGYCCIIFSEFVVFRWHQFCFCFAANILTLTVELLIWPWPWHC